MSRTNDPRLLAANARANPADEPSEIPRDGNWQADHMEQREKALDKVPWYPEAVAPPPTLMPPRARAWEVDRAALNIGLQPQKWDIYNVNVAAVGSGQPQELWAANPGRASIQVITTGAVSILISPTVEKALSGIGYTLAPGAAPFTLNTSGPAWVTSIGAVTVAEVLTTWFESPKSHLPPKLDK